MPSRLLAVTFEAHDLARVADFWAEMLGRKPAETTGGVLLPGDSTQIGLGFAPGRAERAEPDLMHLHLTSSSDADQEQTVAKALELGASHLDVGQRPEEGHIVLADPDGNAFCVIEPGNSFLAGCGFLGELACDGGREVGLFWSAALGWPLVWDQDQETAIQAPVGGTKIAWGGPSDTPRGTAGRQRLELVAADEDRASEVERLTSLGATQRGVDEDGVITLTDPGGNLFRISGMTT